MKNIKMLLLCFSVFFLLVNNVDLFAVEKAINQGQAARQLAELSFNYTAYHDNAMRYALLAVKDRYESNPKTKPYSAILINVFMEVMEEYIADPESQEKVKGISAKLFAEEFTETELREMATFYQGKTGRKALSKLPVIMRRQWELESQLTMPKKYEQLILDKIMALQKQGRLPAEFK